MARQIFVIGIGGTGMRCIESFIHLCAMGMFDDTEVHMLAMDTDKDNGNFSRLKNLKEAYLKTKGVNKRHYPLRETFFSANLHYYQFSPDYSTKSTFEDLFNYGDTQYSNPEKTAVADLLLSEGARTFDLKHGYRAQTHLGAMLMYHSIIDDVMQNDKGDLKRFIQELISASTSGKPRVFILGSVFGGTGASSIPIIPKAIKKSAALISDATDIERNAFFGATILTSYFSFPLPNEDEKAKQKIVATSDRFSLNSQAAMMFYEADKTVKQTYQQFYLMGTETLDWKPGKNQNKTITGGNDQENDSHYIELLSAFAAYQFFNESESNIQDIKNQNNPEYLYRTFDDSGKIDFIDFVGSENKEELAKKFGLFTAMSFLALLDNYNFFEQAQNGELKKVKIEGYEDIDPEEIKNLKNYFRLFHFDFKDGELKEGWLRQLHRSAGGSDKFLFNPALFSSNTVREFSNFSFNDKLFLRGSDFESRKFKTGLFGGIHDTFVSEFMKTNEPDISNNIEKLIKRSYDTLCKLYKFN